MRKTTMMVVLLLAALAVAPVVHHHPVVSSSDDDASASLQTICGVCLHAKVILPPEALCTPPLGTVGLIEAARITPAAIFKSSFVPSRAPPRFV